MLTFWRPIHKKKQFYITFQNNKMSKDKTNAPSRELIVTRLGTISISISLEVICPQPSFHSLENECLQLLFYSTSALLFLW